MLYCIYIVQIGQFCKCGMRNAECGIVAENKKKGTKMKAIEKLWAVVLGIMLTLCMSFGLVGCEDFDKKTKWYSKDTLSWGCLENLPKPIYQYKGYDSTFREIKGSINENDFYQYAQQLLDYMYDKFEYLGTSGKWLQEAGWNPNCQFVRCGQSLEEYRKEEKNTENETCTISYLFVYFLEEPTEQNDGVPDYSTVWYVEITYYLTEQTHRVKDDGEYKDKYKYNFSIQLKKYGVSTYYVYTDYIK